MSKPRVQSIKHAQRESVLEREISSAFFKILNDDPSLHGLFISRVKLTPDRSLCIVYILAQNGVAEYEEKRSRLVLYKSSLRTVVAKTLESRYTPQIRFEYDVSYEKQRSVDELIERLKEEGRL